MTAVPSKVHVIDFSVVSSSPLNPLGLKLRQHIFSQLKYAIKSSDITSIVLTGGKSGNFSAGADLTEFSSAESLLASGGGSVISLIDVVNAIEASPKPTVAAIEGSCLGGGLEVALACHYRVASANKKTQLGLPEVHVGVIPGAGGTQRLPRLIGLQKAVQLILTGAPVKGGSAALKLNLIDAAIDNTKESVLEAAKKWASWAEVLPLETRCLSKQNIKEAPPLAHGIIHAASLALPKPEQGGQGMHAALEAIRAACFSSTFEEGMQAEGELFLQTLVSEQGKARRHAFFAVRRAQKMVKPADKTHPLLQKDVTGVQVAVIGAGTMGGGIALVLLQAGFAVYLVDVSKAALNKGMDIVRGTIQSYVKRKRLTADKAAKLLAPNNLIGTQNLKDLSSCQLVVEAVVENMKIKHKIFSTLNQVTAPSCILLTNTSTLDVDEMATVVDPSRRALFAGWHFFSPANVMKLVEIVVGKSTSSETLALLQALTKKINKIGVVVGNCDGFCGNRMLKPYTGEMVLLLVEGVSTIPSVDKALKETHGFALGPFQMSDLAGNDVGYNVRKARGWVREEGLEPANRPPRYTEMADDMVTKLGRLGQKVGKGWYDYDPTIGKGRKGLNSKEMEDFIKRYMHGGSYNARQLSDDEIIERVLFPLVNEGFKILEEGIALSPGDIDVVWLYGYGWPAWRGGPMHWADHQVGLPNILDSLNRYHHQFPDSEQFAPSKLLEKCVKMGVTVEEYFQKGMHNKQVGIRSNL